MAQFALRWINKFRYMICLKSYPRFLMRPTRISDPFGSDASIRHRISYKAMNGTRHKPKMTIGVCRPSRKIVLLGPIDEILAA